MELRGLRGIAYARCQDWRAIDRFLGLLEYEAAWADASDVDRQCLAALVHSGDRNGVAKWLRNQTSKKLNGKSLRELRNMAMRACVPRYGVMSKDELIQALGGAVQ